jgi:hypothetical protein
MVSRMLKCVTILTQQTKWAASCERNCRLLAVTATASDGAVALHSNKPALFVETRGWWEEGREEGRKEGRNEGIDFCYN